MMSFQTVAQEQQDVPSAFRIRGWRAMMALANSKCIGVKIAKTSFCAGDERKSSAWGEEQ